HIGDAVLEPGRERGQAKTVARIAGPCQTEVDAIEAFGLQARIGLGNIVSDPKRSVKLIDRRGAKARIDRPLGAKAGTERMMKAKAAIDDAAIACGEAIVANECVRRPVDFPPPSLGIPEIIQPDAASDPRRLGKGRGIFGENPG